MVDRDETSLTFEPVWNTEPQQFSSAQYLSVDESKRSRASSDPGGLHICIVPEITITGEDGWNSGSAEDQEFDMFLTPPPQRPRANTCPDEMFRARKGRPPTPPPEDVHILRNPAGKRFSFNYSHKDVNGISFALHRLGKVSEETAEKQQKNKKPHESAASTQISACSRAPNGNPANKDISMDNAFSPLIRSREEAKSSTEERCDPSVSSYTKNLPETAPSNFENTNNNQKHIANRVDDPDVISCSSGACRSNEEGIDNLDSDHLVAF